METANLTEEQRRAADNFAAGLVGKRDWNAEFKQIEQWAVAGQTEILLAITLALTDEVRALGVQDHVRTSLFGSLEWTLALTPGLACADAALRVAKMIRRWTLTTQSKFYKNPQDVSPLLAQAQPVSVLNSLFERHSSDAAYQETLLRLVQEMVLRGTVITGSAADFWLQQAEASKHPLGWLPLTRQPLENDLSEYLPHYSPRSKSCSGMPAVEEGVGTLPAFVTLKAVWTEPGLALTDAERIRSAVHNWEAESNGQSEIRLFQSDRDVPAAAVTFSLLRSLPLECLAGASEADLTLGPVTATFVLSTLFSAACNGGAYNKGVGGACGRLTAWTSLGAMLGAPEGSSLEAIAEQAECCDWFSFLATGGWFYDVAWDVGLICLRPDRRTLLVLAATDTD